MRIYTNPKEAVKEIERDLFEMGTRYDSETVQDRVLTGDEKRTIEYTGYSYKLLFTEDVNYVRIASFWKFFEEALTYMRANILWIQTECEERTGLSGVRELNPGDAWNLHRDFWKPFLRDGAFAYTYGERISPQVPHVIRELRARPNSRQAIITMYDQNKDLMNWGGRDRVPCSISYQFIMREGKLFVIYNQRSCDFLKFLVYDMVFAAYMCAYIAAKIGVQPGGLIHFLGSIHAFESDMKERGIF